MRRRENPYSHLTAKDRDRPSFPTRKLLGLGHIRGRVLDFGCGHGADVDFLRKKGFEVEGYDPHHLPERPKGTFDTILCHYVLNVLIRREQTGVLMDVSEYLKPSGSAYYTVRRDLRREGFRQHYKHNVPTYQSNVRLPFATVVETEFCEIYRYRHYPQTSGPSDTQCQFCSPSTDTTIVTESAQAYAVEVATGDSYNQRLVVPKRHVSNYFELAEAEQRACWLLVDRVYTLFEQEVEQERVEVDFEAPLSKSDVDQHTHIRVTPTNARGEAASVSSASEPVD